MKEYEQWVKKGKENNKSDQDDLFVNEQGIVGMPDFPIVRIVKQSDGAERDESNNEEETW